MVGNMLVTLSPSTITYILTQKYLKIFTKSACSTKFEEKVQLFTNADQLTNGWSIDIGIKSLFPSH